MNKKTKSLNRKNNEFDKQVNAENSVIMTDMVCYLRGANISEYDQEIVRQDLLSMVLSAQNREEDINDVFGGDYKTFCDEVIAALPKRGFFLRALDFLDLFCLCAAILGIINIFLSKNTFVLIKNLFTGKQLNFHISITTGEIFSFILIIAAAYLIVEVICKTSLSTKRKSPLSKKKRFFLGGAAGAGIMGLFLMISWFGQATVFTVNIFVACAVTLAFYLLHLILREVL